MIYGLSRRQEEAAEKAANEERKGIIWWKVGEGKTRIALAWMQLTGRTHPLIVCAPGAFRQWRDEIRLLELGEVIKPVFVSYGKLSWREGNGAPTGYLSNVLDKTNCIVIDELWMYKNVNSKRSRLVTQLTSRKQSIGLSGSLMTSGNLEDVYGQAKAMNLEKKLAPNLSSFREQFTIDTTNYGGFIQRWARKGAMEVIQKRLANNVDIYFPKERRQIRDIKVNVDPSTEQDKLRKELLRTYAYESKGFQLEVNSAASLLVKLQQVSDGFLKDTAGNYLYCKSAKLQRFQELCSELLDAGERILVWVGFRKTAEILSKALSCKTTVLSGDGKFDVLGWRDQKIKVTIATVGSGSSLNDFADVRYAIFYSTTFSSISMQQAKGRTVRKSSLHKCAYYYFLQTVKFPDAQIYQMIEDNRSREELLIKVGNRILAEWKNENPTTAPSR
ncbi:MAG TPA: hypothetical protein VNZ45_01565 [Bacteroidia bacterium]|nr:hypothetical protein [Bacteroidia bacterium]